jgi:spermidine synthase
MRFGKRGGWQGAVDLSRPDRPVFPYQRAFAALVEAHGDMRKFLSVGVGTGTSIRTVRRLQPGVVAHGIEIDEAVLNIAIEYFDAPSHREVDYWIGDGIAFLTSRLIVGYDCVFLGAYMRNSIYQKSLQEDVVDALAEALVEDGVAVYNVISARYEEPSLRAFLASARQVFRTILDWPVGLPLTSQNRLLIVTNRPNYAQSLLRHLRGASVMDFERRLWSIRIRDL